MSRYRAERCDPAARRVLAAAAREATARGDDSVATEHLLLALAGADPVTAALLEAARAGHAQLGQALSGRWSRRSGDDGQQLAALGVDLAQIRARAEQSFGAEALTYAAARARPPRPRRPLWSWISCSKPLPRRPHNPLAPAPPEPIPRMRRLLRRADRDARPGPVTPSHLLLALLNGQEPACELLTDLDIDLAALTAQARKTASTARRP